MKRFFPAIVACMGLVASTPLPAQYEHGRAPGDARLRRMFREQAVAYVGPVARPFVEAYGEDAVAAIAACTPHTGQRLAEFYAGGGLNQLPRPRDLLRVIGQRHHGNEVALFAIEHAMELADPDYFDVYLAHPLEYALGLRSLAADADMRRHSLFGNADSNRAVVALGVAVVGLICLFVWWKRRR